MKTHHIQRSSGRTIGGLDPSQTLLVVGSILLIGGNCLPWLALETPFGGFRLAGLLFRAFEEDLQLLLLVPVTIATLLIQDRFWPRLAWLTWLLWAVLAALLIWSAYNSAGQVCWNPAVFGSCGSIEPTNQVLMFSIGPISLICAWLALRPASQNRRLRGLSGIASLVAIVVALGTLSWFVNITVRQPPVEVETMWMGAGVPAIVMGSFAVLWAEHGHRARQQLSEQRPRAG